MANILNSKYATPVFIVFAVLFIGFNWYAMFRNDSRENRKICKMKAMALKGLIVSETGHNSYNYIEVDNVAKPMPVSISKTKFYRGFDKYYTYTVGDSIIKEAGSGEFTVKKGSKIAVHIIACDD